MGAESDEMHPPYYYVRLRNGQPAIARALTTEEAAPPWSLLGFRPHVEKFFQAGDPELWQITGHWKEDCEPHDFDILLAGGMVGFSQPGAAMPSNQAPLPESHPEQNNWIEETIRSFLKTHGPI